MSKDNQEKKAYWNAQYAKRKEYYREYNKIKK